MSAGSGVVQGLSREKYDREARVNWSTLKLLAKSPAHYRHQFMSPSADSDARKLGRATHLATLEPERFRAECAVWTEGRRYGKKWDAFCAENVGRELLTEAEHARCLAIQGAVRGDPVAAPYLAGGKGEVTLLWTHVVPAIGPALPGYSVDCKGRVDFLASARPAIVDLKTTRDASPDGFGRECYRYRYHTQASFYVDGYEAATGVRLPYVIVAVESAAPFVVQVYRVPDAVLETGREEYRALLDRLQFCRAESKWPGYVDGESELSLPRWAPGNPVDEDTSGLGLEFGSSDAA